MGTLPNHTDTYAFFLAPFFLNVTDFGNIAGNVWGAAWVEHACRRESFPYDLFHKGVVGLLLPGVVGWSLFRCTIRCTSIS